MERGGIIKDPRTLWFNTPDPWTLCRAGGNGPAHPSQLYALKKYAQDGMSMLDIGCGSATTLEAITTDGTLNLFYKGVDMIPKNIEECRKRFPKDVFQVEDGEKLDEDDMSYDIVYSRHVVDHMPSFEKALDEHCRISKNLVLVILWVPFATTDEHQIKPIIDQGKIYLREFTNSYSEKKVMEYLHSLKDFEILEVTKDVGAEVKGHDIVICLKRIHSKDHQK